MTVAEDFRDSLRRAGRPMILRRRKGTSAEWYEVVVRGKTTDFQPTEIIGGVAAGDKRVRLAALDLPEGWAGSTQYAPKKGDSLDGAILQGPAEPLYDGETIVGFKCWTRGA